jgi:hypothetical protein
VLHGKVLYRDVFNLKPPLTTGVHALALLVFGHSMTSIRLLDLLWTMATSLVLYAFVLRAFGSARTATLAGVLYPFQYYGFDFWCTAQTDGWLNLPLATAFLLALRTLRSGSPGTRRAWLAAGTCVGLAALLKYTVVVATPLIAMVVLIYGFGGRRERLTSVAWLATGVILVLALAGLALLAFGAMPAFIESQFGLVPSYARLNGPGGTLIGRFIGPLIGESCLRVVAMTGLAGVLAVAATLFLRPGVRPALVLVACWLAVALFSTISQGKFFLYHFLPLVAVTSVTVTAAWAAFPGDVGPRWSRLIVTALGLVLALTLAATSGYSDRFADLATVVLGRRSLREYWDSPAYDLGADFSLRDDLALSDYLTAHTGPQERVFIWGFEPMVYFVAQRQMVSRFPYTFPLVFHWRPDRFRTEMMAAHSAAPAQVFVVEHGDRQFWVMGHFKDSAQTLHEFEPLRDFVASRYRKELSVGRFDVYRLSRPSAP